LQSNKCSTCSRHTGDKNIKRLSSRISLKLKQYLATTVGAQASLLCLVLLMTSMVLGDGVLTPAQSVLGAIYGLQVKTSVSQGRTSNAMDCAKYTCAAIAYGTSLVPKNSFSTCKLRHCLTALPEVAALWSQAFLTFFDSFCCYKIHFVSGSS